MVHKRDVLKEAEGVSSLDGCVSPATDAFSLASGRVFSRFLSLSLILSFFLFLLSHLGPFFSISGSTCFS